MTTIPYKPAGFTSLAPYLMMKNADEAIALYKRAFDAVELFRHTDANGTIRHAEIKIDDTVLMLAEDFGGTGNPHALGGSPIHLHLYVKDVDALAKHLVAIGMTEIAPVDTKDDSDRRGGFTDPYGFTWWIAQQVRDISRTDLMKQYETLKEG